MVFLMMNTLSSKHVEDTKNWIKNIDLKSVHFVGLGYIIKSECRVHKTQSYLF